jgi:hypothetical protein
MANNSIHTYLCTPLVPYAQKYTAELSSDVSNKVLSQYFFKLNKSGNSCPSGVQIFPKCVFHYSVQLSDNGLLQIFAIYFTMLSVLVNSIILPLVLYECETWSLTS